MYLTTIGLGSQILEPTQRGQTRRTNVLRGVIGCQTS